MDYCNFNNTDFENTDFGHSIPSAYGGLYQYPFLGQARGVEGAITQAHQAPADTWSSIPWQDPVAGQPTNLLAATSHGKSHRNSFADLCLPHEASESVAGAASITGELDGCGQPLYAHSFPPASDQQPQSWYPDFLSQDALFAGSTMAPNAPAIIPAPSSGKDYPHFAI